METETLSWEEKVERYADVVYLNLKRQIDAKNITEHRKGIAILTLVSVLADGSDILINEGEQTASMSMGFLSGYVMGRVH